MRAAWPSGPTPKSENIPFRPLCFRGSRLGLNWALLSLGWAPWGLKLTLVDITWTHQSMSMVYFQWTLTVKECSTYEFKSKMGSQDRTESKISLIPPSSGCATGCSVLRGGGDSLISCVNENDISQWWDSWHDLLTNGSPFPVQVRCNQKLELMFEIGKAN